MENNLRVGVITSTHGLKGEVKVFSTTDDNNRFKDLKEVLLDTGKELLPLTITNVKFFKQMVILQFKEFNHINEVEKFKGKELYVTRENAVKLDEGEYFITDLIGLTVYTEDQEPLGELVDVLQTGANDVYIIKGKEKEILIPAIKDCIISVDIVNRTMQVKLIEGLLEL